jgi:small GTP-binding protein
MKKEKDLVNKKICIIGDNHVGKTSLISRFVDGEFRDKYLSTVGVKIYRKVVEIQSHNNREKPKIQLLIWDIEGKSKFNSIVSNYLEGAQGAIIVADLSRPETIDKVQEHRELFYSVNPQESKVLVALNKSDLLNKESLKRATQQSFLDRQNQEILAYTTSAKTGENVEQIFQKLACLLINSKEVQKLQEFRSSEYSCF